MERITSHQNSLCIRIRKLNASRRFRREEGAFVVEGPKLLDEAVKNRASLQTVVYTEGARPGPTIPESVRQTEVPASLFKSLSDTETPQGVLAVCSLPGTGAPSALPGGRLLVLDGVQDPGNVGTIWRTADAFEAAGLVLLPGCADPFAPKTVRATMGACFRLPVWELSAVELRRLLGDTPLYAAALGPDAADPRTLSLKDAAVVIGSEGRGVSPQVLALCERTLKIPMSPRCESLNAAAAAAVLLWEGWRGAEMEV